MKIAAALAQVSQNSNPAWTEKATKAVLQAAKTFPEFTSDEATVILESLNPPPTSSARALGQVFLKLQRDGVIKRTDRVRNSKRDELNHQRLSVWVSSVYGKA